MATPQIVALPRLRLACRALPDHADDADLVLAEAGALLTWARELGRASAPWLVVDGDLVEVAVPIPADAELPDGLRERTLTEGIWAALAFDEPTPAAAQRAAEALREQPPGPIAEASGPLYVRLGDQAEVHLPTH